MPHPVYPVFKEDGKPVTFGTLILREFAKWYKDAGYGTYNPTMADRANAKKLITPKEEGGFGYPIGYALEICQLFFWLRKTDPRYRRAPVTFGMMVWLRNDLIAQAIDREKRRSTSEDEF